MEESGDVHRKRLNLRKEIKPTDIEMMKRGDDSSMKSKKEKMEIKHKSILGHTHTHTHTYIHTYNIDRAKR